MSLTLSPLAAELELASEKPSTLDVYKRQAETARAAATTVREDVPLPAEAAQAAAEAVPAVVRVHQPARDAQEPAAEPVPELAAEPAPAPAGNTARGVPDAEDAAAPAPAAQDVYKRQAV